jgi:hypothetical protein
LHGLTIPSGWDIYGGMKEKNPAAVALGKLGGRAVSRKKILAARRNGKLGGRPKVTKPA